MREEDILLWPDGFWCFRFELRDGFKRDYQYRVVQYQSEQWQKMSQWPRYSRDVSLPPSVSR